jgi:hypothetical protein
LSPAKKPSSLPLPANLTPNPGKRMTNHQMSSAQGLFETNHPCCKKRFFSKLLDKLKPLILDESQNIEDTIGPINLFVIHAAKNNKKG